MFTRYTITIVCATLTGCAPAEPWADGVAPQTIACCDGGADVLALYPGASADTIAAHVTAYARGDVGHDAGLEGQVRVFADDGHALAECDRGVDSITFVWDSN